MHAVKRLYKKSIEVVFVNPLASLVKRVSEKVGAPQITINRILKERALIDSAEYAEAHMAEALSFNKRESLWIYALRQVDTEGLFAEFGVFKGYSINFFAERIKGRIYGFDSFEGLKEDWAGHELSKGHFNLGGRLPKVRRNVELVKGWFDDTVPPFLRNHAQSFAFVHIDSDTYASAAALLKLIGSRLRSGTVIVFDEYFGYRGWRIGEWKAWQEFCAQSKLSYRYLGFAAGQVAVKID